MSWFLLESSTVPHTHKLFPFHEYRKKGGWLERKSKRKQYWILMSKLQIINEKDIQINELWVNGILKCQTLRVFLDGMHYHFHCISGLKHISCRNDAVAPGYKRGDSTSSIPFCVQCIQHRWIVLFACSWYVECQNIYLVITAQGSQEIARRMRNNQCFSRANQF